MHSITVSAPGKIYLLGEHAVVYGKPALLATLNLRLKVTVTQLKQSSLQPKIVTSATTDYIEKIIELVKDKYQISKLSNLEITIDSQIPSGFHLGSSAAVAVATIGALIYYLKKIWNPVDINQLAYQAEKYQHGNPSGADNTAVTIGGFVWYRKELEFLKSIWQMPFKISRQLNHFFLINTGKPAETTRQMVNAVKTGFDQQKLKFEQIFLQNEEQTRCIAQAIKNQDEAGFIKALKIGESTLEKIGVVSRKVMPCIREIEKKGGAAKILGGGGKIAGVGFLLGYHQNQDLVNKICSTYGFSTQQITLGGEGVRIETSY